MKTSELSPLKLNTVIDALEALNGYPHPFSPRKNDALAIKRLPQEGLNYTQFNELQLSLGYARVSRTFFQYMVDGTAMIKSGARIKTLKCLVDSVYRFMKLALRYFGNIRIPFDVLSGNADILKDWIDRTQELKRTDYQARDDPLFPLEEIPGKETYFLGHFIVDEYEKKKNKGEYNNEFLQEYEKSLEIREIGKKNFESYLATDLLDVYIATSMRAREEYFFINKWVKEIFNSKLLEPLKLRWFDPTQAFCDDRIDKGLFEGLMLKRAQCTIYFIQESDTFGKDSELASTLAQGKPAIAFIPRADENYFNEYLENLKEIYDDKKEEEIVIDKIQEYNSELAWKDQELRRWIDKSKKIDLERAKEKLHSTLSKIYDKRASSLMDDHPLGLQIEIDRGVANGVLVVRDILSCAKIIERIVTHTLEFSLKEHVEGDHRSLYLVEDISNCIYRLATGNEMLTNSFWNYYITPCE